MCMYIRRPETREAPTIRCRDPECIRNTFAKLGLLDAYNKLATKTRIGTFGRIIVTEVTDYLCEDRCTTASLASLVSRVYIVGEATVYDKSGKDVSCGPDVYYVPCYAYKLAPGAVAYLKVRGYAGDTSLDNNRFYVNPPKKAVGEPHIEG